MTSTIRGCVGSVNLALVAMLIACAATEAPPGAPAAAAPEPALVGTAWRLVEIQMMDDTTLRPESRSLYTVRLQADGSATFRLNCNRASGAWQVSPDAGGAAGNLTIGPLAVTRATCPPPSLDARIARDMGWVRGFLIRGGRLGMSLYADGGIYLWEPDPDAR